MTFRDLEALRKKDPRTAQIVYELGRNILWVLKVSQFAMESNQPERLEAAKRLFEEIGGTPQELAPWLRIGYRRDSPTEVAVELLGKHSILSRSTLERYMRKFNSSRRANGPTFEWAEERGAIIRECLRQMISKQVVVLYGELGVSELAHYIATVAAQSNRRILVLHAYFTIELDRLPGMVREFFSRVANSPEQQFILQINDINFLPGLDPVTLFANGLAYPQDQGLRNLREISLPENLRILGTVRMRAGASNRLPDWLRQTTEVFLPGG